MRLLSYYQAGSCCCADYAVQVPSCRHQNMYILVGTAMRFVWGRVLDLAGVKMSSSTGPDDVR